MIGDFFGSSLLPPNPKELALTHADNLSRDAFDHNQEDLRILEELEKMSEDLDFLGHRYFVEGTRSFVVPVDVEEPQTTFDSYYDVMFEGQLISYSRLSIGKLIGHQSVRALCLTFDKALVLPSFTEVNESELLHIPAYAIDSIVRAN